MRRSRERRLPLRHAEVGAAGQPDPPVRPRLGGGPLDGIVAVILLLEERGEGSFGAHRSPDLLQDADVAILRPRDHRRTEEGSTAVAQQSAIWIAYECDRVAAGRCWLVDLGI